MKEATDLQDRQLSAALFPEPVVRTLFKVLRAQARRSNTITRELFSKAFSPYEKTASRLFNFSSEALNELCDEKVRVSIELLLENDEALDMAIEAQLQNHQHRINDLVSIVERLCRALLPYYQGQYKILAKALNVPQTTFQVARQGDASEAYTIELIENMRSLAQHHGVGGNILKDMPAKKETPIRTPPEKPKENLIHEWVIITKRRNSLEWYTMLTTSHGCTLGQIYLENPLIWLH